MIRAIVLAAGKGTRMKSSRPKVLHDLCGRPMLWYVLNGLREAGIDDVVVVVAADVRERIASFGVRTVVQAEQRGTGDAVRAALGRHARKRGRPHRDRERRHAADLRIDIFDDESRRRARRRAASTRRSLP